MEKGITHLLIPETTKVRRKKLSFETNISQQPPILQSVKHVFNSALNDVPSNRYKEYQRQSNKVRAIGARAAKDYGKVNRSAASKKKTAREFSAEVPNTTKGTKMIKLKNSALKESCRMNSIVSMEQPMPINMSMNSNNLIGLENKARAGMNNSNKKVNLNLIGRRNYALSKGKQKPSNGLGLTQPVAGISELVHKPRISNKDLPQSRLNPIKDVGVKKHIESLVQNDLKAARKAQTQRFSLWNEKRAGMKQSDTGIRPFGIAVERTSNSIKQAPSFPLTPMQVLRYFAGSLADYEKGEILDYENIYFIGNDSTTRSALDDEKGDYIAYVGNHIAYRYEVIDIFGEGSFGQALRCKDHKTEDVVALKIIRNNHKYHRQAMVEVKILRFLKAVSYTHLTLPTICSV
eukprot:TRINITY_DN12872_c0_g1_i3.p1 TRINITY_DN12872_c0_g1~~TRINITY_DN12872_c0_g1_i3.p1  ORF type:complete len:405 (+),score=45.91 TRINITY_DN12872_c0_g1_i3:120-1334(+)